MTFLLNWKNILIFDKLIATADRMQSVLEETSDIKVQHDFPWPALSYGPCEKFRRADLDIIDAREDKKLWMMHLVVYPHLDDGSPIFGFDIIAGPKKITGAFHDFSPVNNNSYIIPQFAEKVKDFIPSKKRELPDWAKNIFSGHMISAGNVRDDEEINKIMELAVSNLKMIISELPNRVKGEDWSVEHDWYCYNQKQNPHTPKVMESLGVDPVTVRTYIDECLFPELSPNSSDT